MRSRDCPIPLMFTVAFSILAIRNDSSFPISTSTNLINRIKTMLLYVISVFICIAMSKVVSGSSTKKRRSEDKMIGKCTCIGALKLA